MVHSSSDLSAAYYCFGLERSWWGFMAMDPPIPGSAIADLVPELQHEKEVYACCCVLAMGLNSASGLMQYAHMRMVSELPPAGANLPASQQL
eukprot:4743521-Karenia_brevis.AAC.1